MVNLTAPGRLDSPVFSLDHEYLSCPYHWIIDFGGT